MAVALAAGLTDVQEKHGSAASDNCKIVLLHQTEFTRALLASFLSMEAADADIGDSRARGARFSGPQIRHNPSAPQASDKRSHAELQATSNSTYQRKLKGHASAENHPRALSKEGSSK